MVPLSLSQTTLCTVMLLQITAIQFDFTCDNPDDYITEDQEVAATDAALGQLWEVDDEDDLADEVTAAYGWCIKSIDYRHCLA